MENLLLKDVKYAWTETAWGRQRRFLYPGGQLFEEYVSNVRLFGWPLVHITRGKCPETGKRIIARGFIAIGRVAVGGVAVGQASFGVVAVGQLAVGLLFGLGQAATGVLCIGQLAIGLLFGLGQFVTGAVAIGQIGLGIYVLAQAGFGKYVWDSANVAPEAQQFFEFMWAWWR